MENCGPFPFQVDAAGEERAGGGRVGVVVFVRSMENIFITIHVFGHNPCGKNYMKLFKFVAMQICTIAVVQVIQTNDRSHFKSEINLRINLNDCECEFLSKRSMNNIGTGLILWYSQTHSTYT